MQFGRLLRVGGRGLIAAPNVAAFRCVAARVDVQNGVANVASDTISALNLAPGAEALVWVSDDAV